ncbi:ABC transporter ATP-binding protein [Bacillus sp. FJAT-29937]|uniref:ABC transporter ATP-binding protein n=1 Tax=Bacillus sp. FJAT-29937 TaxID=1720553 RepID=UPI000829C8F0|nr:ABC transporter ATP-binding protein [Bacillus sp. FJAT-29937]
MTEKLLEVNKLSTHFYTERGKLQALKEISFHVGKGEVLAVVGESGCGKSVTSQSILRLFDEKHLVEYDGEILFENRNLLNLPLKDMESIRGNEISMIFQDPLSSLDPVYTIGHQIAQVLRIHKKISKKEAYEKAIEYLKLTGIPSPEKRINEYPHELSGGMQQRVMIAMALACEPKLLIADEPTTALDVTIQAQILDLITYLNQKIDMGIILVTHDLGVVAEVCTRVLVMYLGQVVEEADVNRLFERPLHPYTKGLIKSIPQLDGNREEDLHVIKGNVPALDKAPKGCRFSTRCPYADEKCHQQNPELESYDEKQKVRCWHYKEILLKEAT